jgi:iron complex outermembrane recepter protein
MRFARKLKTRMATRSPPTPDAEYVNYPDGPCPIEAALLPAQCDLSGQPLAGTPDVSWTLAMSGGESLHRGFRLYWRLDHSHQSGLFAHVSNSRHSRVESYGLSNLGVGLRWNGDRWDLGFWIRNLFDEEYFQLTNGLSTGLVIGIPGEPRTQGVTLRARF